MGIADNLKSLQDLRDKGQLTEAEHSAAKAKLLEQEPPNEVAMHVGRVFRTAPVASVIGLLVTAAAIGFGFAWYKASTVHLPIQLMDKVQSVPANAWEAMPFTLPYSGSVVIRINVMDGNPMDVLVITPDQLANLKANNGQKIVEYTDFDAQGTRLYERSASLQRGSYCLILRDTALGIFPANASEIAVKIQLKP